MSALPTYVIIGVAKCGTTSLHHYLGQHPEIQVSRRKELRFFIDEPRPEYRGPGSRRLLRGEWHRGEDWYRSWFSPDHRVRGEATPGYMSVRYEGAAERMRRVVPDARLIVCVRDPVARAISHYRQALGDRYERRPAAEALTPDSSYVKTSRYAELLAPFLEHWSTDRIHVVAQEDLLARRRETLSSAFGFLGVDPDHWSPGYERRLNVSARKTGFLWVGLQALRRRRWWHRVADRAPRKTLTALDWLSTVSGPPHVEAPVTEELREQIAQAVSADAEDFRRLTGRAFPEWTV